MGLSDHASIPSQPSTLLPKSEFLLFFFWDNFRRDGTGTVKMSDARRYKYRHCKIFCHLSPLHCNSQHFLQNPHCHYFFWNYYTVKSYVIRYLLLCCISSLQFARRLLVSFSSNIFAKNVTRDTEKGNYLQ